MSAFLFFLNAAKLTCYGRHGSICPDRFWDTMLYIILSGYLNTLYLFEISIRNTVVREEIFSQFCTQFFITEAAVLEAGYRPGCPSSVLLAQGFQQAER